MEDKEADKFHMRHIVGHGIVDNREVVPRFLRLPVKERNVYDMDDLTPTHEIVDPNIVESRTTAIFLCDGDHSKVTEPGWLDIKVANAVSVAHERDTIGEIVVENVA